MFCRLPLLLALGLMGAGALAGPAEQVSKTDGRRPVGLEPLDRSLRVGVRVSAKGRMSPGGLLAADEVELERSEGDDEELQGPITDLDSEAGTLSLLGRTVRLRSNTRYTREPDEPAAISDLRDGLRVKIEGDSDSEGRLKADKVRIYRDQTPGKRVKVEGLIASIDPSTTGVAEMRVAGVRVLLRTGTELIGARGGSRPVSRRLGVLDDDDLQFVRDTHLGRYVTVAGEVRIKGEFVSSLDDGPDNKEFVPEINAVLGFQARFGIVKAFASVVGEREFVLSDESGLAEPFEEGNSTLRIGEAYLQVPLAPGLAITFGRQAFREERDWYYSTSSLDGVRLFVEWYSFHLEGSLSRDLFDKHRNQRNQDLVNVIFRGSYRVARDVDLEAFFVDRSDQTELGDSLRTYGLRVVGDPGRHLEFWVEVARQTGTQCSRIGTDGTDTGRLCSRDELPGQFNVRDVRAHAFDLGLTYRPRVAWDPTFTVAYAFGSGEDDTIRSVDPDQAAARTATSFRQTGLHRNTWKFNGNVSFRFYGEVMNPTLTNLSISTFGVGLRPGRAISADLIYHGYRQDEASRSFHDFDNIGESPSGASADIGHELDLVFGYEPSRWLELRLTAGLFEPGDAFDDDATRAEFSRFQVKFRF